jgi:hypothetical protein
MVEPVYAHRRQAVARVRDGRLPDKKLPRGFYLVHNQVQPQRPLGKKGFRAWVQTEKDNLVPCKCSFAGNKNAKLNKHYRVRLKDD